jgi:hypothetical protein
MTEVPNSAAPHHLPFFITAPEQTDVLLVAMLIFLLAAVLFIGNLYFQLHSLPERMAHRVNHVQMQVVAVLCLLALFTHNHVFWVAALLLALVQLPDFSTPVNSIAQSLEKMAGGSKPFPPQPPVARPIDEDPSLHGVSVARARLSSAEKTPHSARQKPAKTSPAQLSRQEELPNRKA